MLSIQHGCHEQVRVKRHPIRHLFRCLSKPVLRKIDRPSGNDANSRLAVLDLTNDPGGGIACRNDVLKQTLRSAGAA